MADRQILFKAPMVRALLDGRKTQTRRALGSLDVWRNEDGSEPAVACLHVEGEAVPRVTIGNVVTVRKLKAAIGDRLWVREAWQGLSPGDYLPTKSKACELRYAATDPCADLEAEARGYPWRPSIFMPRFASRLTLTVTDVRVERLQDISEEDALAEGMRRLDGPLIAFGADADAPYAPSARAAYSLLWDDINDAGAWKANPWVAAYTFTVQRGNIDEVKPHGR